MKKYIGPLLLLITALIWGFAFPFQKEAAEILPMTPNAVRQRLHKTRERLRAYLEERGYRV